MIHQPKAECFQMLSIQVAAYVFFIVGFTLVMSSFFALGVTGTFLGNNKKTLDTNAYARR